VRFAVIVAAAGSGTRLGAEEPKAFIPLGGRPLLAWSLTTFRELPGCAQVVLVVPAGLGARARELLGPGGGTVVPGGDRRQDSVWAALAAVGPGVELVAVHDAARPLVAAEDIRRTLDAAAAAGGAILARPVTDTLKRVAGDRIVGGADRAALWRAETPQIFRPAVLRTAYEKWAGGLATDEAQMVEAAGGEVRVVEARAWNPKITYRTDLELVKKVVLLS
jgi:2-C-methyl-D-erythritol 4-phosphate cytidylyltransferase